jgi:hypothetical protein
MFLRLKSLRRCMTHQSKRQLNLNTNFLASRVDRSWDFYGSFSYLLNASIEESLNVSSETDM